MGEARAAADDRGASSSPMEADVSESILDWLVCNAPIIFAIFDSDGICRKIRGRALDAIGLESSEAVGKSISEIAPGVAEVTRNFSDCLEGERRCFQAEIRGRIFDVCCEPLKDDSRRISGVVMVGTDVTDTVAATRALAAEEELLKATIEAVGDAVIATDAGMKIVLFNQAAEDLTGWPKNEALGKDLGEVVRFESVDKKGGRVDVSGLARSSIEQSVPIDSGALLRLERKDGTQVEVAAHYAPIKAGGDKAVGAVLSIRDVSEERRRDEERIRLEKLESLALMASGLSHDFNNMLTAILANLGLAKERAGSGPVVEFIEEAEIAANQARDLTNQLASFARPTPKQLKAVDLRGVLTQATAFALAGKDVEHEVHIADNLWPVLGDENQLIQAFNNLLLNAQQAMPQGGCITIRAENLVVTEGEPKAGAYLGGGKFVKVIIEDQGVGIPPENLEKVFDPYFTTKAGGTGLGLPTTYSIIKKHGGHMSIFSTVGEGTVVLVYLPAVDAAIQAPGGEPAEESSGTEGLPGKRVLVMDDEAGVRKVAKLALEGAGWEVEVAEDAIHAIEKFREALEKHRPFDVVVLDSMMRSGLDGSATLAELAKLDPSVKAVAISGLVDEATTEEFRRKGFSQVVAKPFSLDDLRSAVGRAVSEKR